MAIINRNLGKSEQRLLISQEYAPAQLVTGATNVIGMVPAACNIDFVQYAAYGLSNTPNVQILINRFIPTVGFTAFNLGSTNLLVSYGTSGVATFGCSLPQIGTTTLTSLLANDVVLFQVGGTNAAMTGFSVSVILRPIQDIIKLFNVL